MLNKVLFPEHKYASAYVWQDNDGYTLVSYSTCVAHLDNDGWLTVNGLYSATTRKHLGWFAKYVARLANSTVTYYDMKRCYKDRQRYNVLTGEVQDR